MILGTYGMVVLSVVRVVRIVIRTPLIGRGIRMELRLIK